MPAADVGVGEHLAAVLLDERARRRDVVDAQRDVREADLVHGARPVGGRRRARPGEVQQLEHERTLPQVAGPEPERRVEAQQLVAGLVVELEDAPEVEAEGLLVERARPFEVGHALAEVVHHVRHDGSITTRQRARRLVGRDTERFRSVLDREPVRDQRVDEAAASTPGGWRRRRSRDRAQCRQ